MTDSTTDASSASEAFRAAANGTPAGIDPRAPRLVAAVNALVALIVVGLAVTGAPVAAAIALALLAALFLWTAAAGVRRHPVGVLFRRLVRPFLGPPSHLEDPAAPTFAQGVGAVISVAGLLGALPWGAAALAIGGALVFVAAFLNSVFDVCLGCHLYVLLVRVRTFRRAA